MGFNRNMIKYITNRAVLGWCIWNVGFSLIENIGITVSMIIALQCNIIYNLIAYYYNYMCS